MEAHSETPHTEIVDIAHDMASGMRPGSEPGQNTAAEEMVALASSEGKLSSDPSHSATIVTQHMGSIQPAGAEHQHFVDPA